MYNTRMFSDRLDTLFLINHASTISVHMHFHASGHAEINISNHPNFKEFSDGM